MKQQVLAARVAMLMACSAGGFMMPAQAQWIVNDPPNLIQNTMTTLEEVAQTLKQIEEYRTQLQQYENMIQNTLAPAAYVWDKATGTMNKLRGAIDTLNAYKTRLGSLDAYLGKFQDAAYYRGSPCFQKEGCTAAQWAALRDSQLVGSEAQKKATDALFRGLDQQQDAMEADARTLERLQAGAQGASGQMQALGYANQLASQQANQLLQMRGLLIAQQNAIATRQQALADLEAKQQAAHEASTEARIDRTTSPKNWLDMNR